MRQALILILTILFLCSSCTTNENYECFSSPIQNNSDDGLTITHPGLELSLVEENIPIRRGDVVAFKVQNLTENRIWFPRDYNVAIYEVIESNKFQKINDRMNHEYTNEIILEPNGEIGSSSISFTQPDLPTWTGEIQILISVWGTGYRDGMYCDDKYGGGFYVTILP